MVELRRLRRQTRARSSRCRDLAGCITATRLPPEIATGGESPRWPNLLGSLRETRVSNDIQVGQIAVDVSRDAAQVRTDAPHLQLQPTRSPETGRFKFWRTTACSLLHLHNASIHKLHVDGLKSFFCFHSQYALKVARDFLVTATIARGTLQSEYLAQTIG